MHSDAWTFYCFGSLVRGSIFGGIFGRGSRIYQCEDMLVLLVLIVFFTVCTSFLCSMTEAALYSVPQAHLRHMSEQGSRTAKIMLRLKEEISRPIAAVLIINTFANVLGPSFAGVMVVTLWGEDGLVIFSVLLGLAILFLGEITPKILGAHFSKELVGIIAVPLAFLVSILSPLIRVTQCISRRLEQSTSEPRVSHHEVLSLAAIGQEEGSLDNFEGSVIANVIGLDQLLVRDVMTPRTSVFRADQNMILSEVRDQIGDWSFTRVPLFDPNEPEHLNGYVLQRDLHRALLRGEESRTLFDFRRKLKTVPEVMRSDRLLTEMFDEREQIAAAVDEFGGLAGIITIENILEEVVGREIIDEYDLDGMPSGGEPRNADKVQQFARNREKKMKKFRA